MSENLYQNRPPEHRLACASGGSGYGQLARATWTRRKGRFVRRPVARLEIALYTVAARPVLQNTSCTALIGRCDAAASSVPLPP